MSASSSAALRLERLDVLGRGLQLLLDALLDVAVLAVAVEIARDGVEEAQRFLPRGRQVLLVREQVEQLGAALGDLARELARVLAAHLVQLGVERVRGVVVLGAGAAHGRRVDALGAVQHVRELEHLLDGAPVRGVQPLRVELDGRVLPHGVGHGREERDAVVLGRDVVRQLNHRVVAVHHPVQHVGHEPEVGHAEVVDADEARVAPGKSEQKSNGVVVK